MAQLCIYLNPFASDYTGVCSALFDFDCLIAVNDASCCTGHYVFFDEPRWKGKQRPTFSTQLRNVDAILGNDDKVISHVLEMDREIGTAMIALVGTPVPAITGMDMVGMAWEIEEASGKPSLGFATTGIKYYDSGIAAAGKTLIKRFAEEHPVGISTGEKAGRKVNVLGFTPLDYGDNGNETDLEKALEEMGYAVNARLFMGSDIDDVRRLSAGEMNIAVSSAGLECAKLLERKFGTPYVAAAPMGSAYLKTALGGRTAVSEPGAGRKTLIAGRETLIIGDQVMASSLREALRMKGCSSGLSVGGFFGWDRSIAEAGDIHFRSEREYIDALRSGRFTGIIGDPVFMRPPEADGLRQIEIVHPAVSGRTLRDGTCRYLSETFDSFLTETAELL